MKNTDKIRFSAIGLDHFHIFGQTQMLLDQGAELVSYFAAEDARAAAYGAAFPQARRAASVAEILEDESIALVTAAGINCERAPLGLAVMRHGKDFLVDKPGFTTLEQLAEVRRVQAETRRQYIVLYGERLESPATEEAARMARSGAIGRVVQTIGWGPHRTHNAPRPAWFFERAKFGGIIADIGVHQIEQFLYITQSDSAEIEASHVANYKHAEHAGFEDFGDALLRGNRGTGYFRVDWLTPNGLPVFGDSRLTVVGSDGYIEIRKHIDIAGREGGNHLFITDHKAVRRIDCNGMPTPFARNFVNDVIERTDTALGQRHCFLVSELALKAQAAARRLD